MITKKKKDLEPNRYNLKVSDLKYLKVRDKSLLNKENGFWRNNVINAWCCSEDTSNDSFGSDYWIGCYDDGKVKVTFSAYGGMCNYNFKRFYNLSEMENDDDVKVQEMFMKRINYLLDNEILILDKFGGTRNE